MFGISAFAESPFASLSGVTIVVALTGVVAAGAVGTVTHGKEVAITGVGSSGLIANLVGGQPLTGVQAAGSVGTLVAVYWRSIDDSQTANWQNITDSQSAGWQLIETAV